MPASSALSLVDRPRTAFGQTLRRRAVTVPAAIAGLVIVAPLLAASLPLLAALDLIERQQGAGPDPSRDQHPPQLGEHFVLAAAGNGDLASQTWRIFFIEKKIRF